MAKAYVKKILAHSDPEAVYASRVRGRQILLENPTRESKLRQQNSQKAQRWREKRAARAKGLIGQKEAKPKGLWSLDKEQAM
jgi:ribonuclease P protein subunit POP4